MIKRKPKPDSQRSFDFLAIGNGEKCPFCDKVMIDFKIDGLESTDHFTKYHPKEFQKAVFGEK